MDPLTIVSTCISIAKEIYSLKKRIEFDDLSCVDFFNHIEGLNVSLQSLASLDSAGLTSRSISLKKVEESLRRIDEIVQRRIKDNKTSSGKLMNIFKSYTGSFADNLDELKYQLGCCLENMKLAVAVDTLEASQTIAHELKTQNHEIADSKKMTQSVQENTNIILNQNAILSEQLNQVVESIQNISCGSMENVFVKDPFPLDHYDDRSILGFGSFGVTHRMVNILDKGYYAVKEIKIREAQNQGITKDRLVNESVILQQLSHPGIVKYVTSYFSRNQTIYNLVMELIDGCSISELINGQSVSICSIEMWLSQVVNALMYLHFSKHIQHRDIRPENIMLTNNKIKLIDLGMACIIKSTVSSVRRGAIEYSSYEKSNGIPYDGRDDVWAVGCVFAELLTQTRLNDRGRLVLLHSIVLLSGAGGAIYLYTNGVVNQRRLQLLFDCVSKCARLGSIIAQMLEPEQEKRLNSMMLDQLISRSAAQQVCSASLFLVILIAKHFQKTEDLRDSVVEICSSMEQIAGGSDKCTVSESQTVVNTSDMSISIGSTKNVFILQGCHQVMEGYFICFCPDRSLYAFCTNSTICVYETGSRICVSTINDETTIRVLCAQFCSDGSGIVVGCDNSISLFDSRSLTRVWRFPTSNIISSISFVKNDSLIFAAVGNNSIVWLNVSGKFVDQRDISGLFGFSCIENGIIAAGQDKFVVLEGNSMNIGAVVKCPNIQHICASSDGKRVVVGVNWCVTAPDKSIITNSLSSIQIWDSPHRWSFSLTKTIRGYLRLVNCLSLSNDGSMLAGCGDKIVAVWNTSKLELVDTFVSTNDVGCVAFDSENQLLFVEVLRQNSFL